MKTSHRNDWLIVGMICTVLFISLAGMVAMNWPLGLAQFDTSIQLAIQPLVTSQTTWFLTLAAMTGSPVVVIMLVMVMVVWYFCRDERVLAIWLGGTLLGGEGLAFMFKEVIQRARPTQQLVAESGFSFPSGHAFSAALLVLIVIFVIVPQFKNPEVQLIVILTAGVWFLVIAFSRIYLRAHFPSDIIGSVLLALAWWSGMLGFKQRYTRIIARLVGEDSKNKKVDSHE
ncbi:PAP2 family protein [Lactobacillus sp. CBA3605]|uniref:phosphatase PAP2 family protein n=1 Tax=Lactobacillus sp. CBA3605 TaxID=2099788 RepID=UPI000CFDBF12|nr:phosphatase PAP2 family protein [Lactobacillus sp. CBA3605]AVK61537.1 PAP2 family protein [Lactobacillus sp. CBA3605]